MAGVLPVTGEDITLVEWIKTYWQYATEYYRSPDASPTSELGTIRQALRHAKDLYGRTPANQFGPRALKDVRQQMVDSGNSRGYVNALVDRVRRMCKWAVAQELVPARAYHALQIVDGLGRGRAKVRETEPVRPVPGAHINTIRRFVAPRSKPEKKTSSIPSPATLS